MALILVTQKYLVPTGTWHGDRYCKWNSGRWHMSPILNKLTNQGTEMDTNNKTMQEALIFLRNEEKC